MLQEDEHGEFLFMVSHIISPEEMYLHPVSEMSGQLTKLEEDLAIHAESQQITRVVEVVVGSVWRCCWRCGTGSG